jgi:hypothetical protein
MVMFGALYQMIAVVVGSPVPWVRAAHGVHALFATGVAVLCWGIANLSSAAVFAALGMIGPALILFLGPVSVALSRARSMDATTFGICSALVCFFFAASAGIWMAHGFSGMHFPGPRALWIQAHASVALLGWVGGLLTAVSWQVLPMFYLARELPSGFKWTLQVVISLSALLPVLILVADYFELVMEVRDSLPVIVALTALPALVCVWFLHPAASHSSLQRRRRRRVDGSLLFWRAGLAIAPIVGIAALAAYGLAAERWDLIFGWLALWGWAGMIVHGMLTRIVPFLVWLHRFAPLVGEVAVPSVRKLLPDRWTRVGLGLHLGSLVIGSAAIASGSDALARLTGLALLATAVWLEHSLIHVLRQRP